jgi:hypothetical protein
LTAEEQDLAQEMVKQVNILHQQTDELHEQERVLEEIRSKELANMQSNLTGQSASIDVTPEFATDGTITNLGEIEAKIMAAQSSLS